MKDITTRYGVIPATGRQETHADGTLLSCRPGAPCVLETPLGPLTPQHTTDDLRKKEVQPVVFHQSGVIRYLPLESQTMVPTPAGDIAAEMVTFHPDGCLSRIFPLNGKLSGYWSQEDEAGLAAPTTLLTPVGVITAMIINVSFYPSGAMRSITLWPGQALSIPTPAGVIQTRMGVAFGPDGAVRSIEPSKPTPVATPAGEIMAYDPDAVGINGDVNSLVFDDDGGVARIATTLTRLTVAAPDGRTTTFLPEERESLCGDTEREMVPMTVQFTAGTVIVRTSPETLPALIPRAGHAFFTAPYLPQLAHPFGQLRCSI
jgi:hypothetical protein